MATKSETAARAKVIAQVVSRETALIAAEGDARKAYRLSITGRFGESVKLEPADLAPVYKVEKTRANRCAELNRAMAVGQALGVAHATGLMDACDLLGRGALRETWRDAANFAFNAVRELRAADASAKVNAVNIVRDFRATLEAKVKAEADKADFQRANLAASKAEAQAKAAAARVAKLQAKADEGDEAAADQLEAAEDAAKDASVAARKLRTKADAAKAKLPTPPAPAPKTLEARVQDVRVAIGEAPSPQLLAALLRDVVGQAAKHPALAKDAAELGKVAERWAAVHA